VAQARERVIVRAQTARGARESRRATARKKNGTQAKNR